MKKFIYSQNNGVVAIIRQDHAQKYGMIKKAGGDPTKAGVKVFTFGHGDSPMLQYYSGTHELLGRLRKSGKMELIQVSSNDGWDGNVPFSNGYMIAQDELQWRTSAEDFINVFDLLGDATEQGISVAA